MNPENFDLCEKHIVDVGWDIVETSGSAIIPIEELYATIMTKDGSVFLKITETPHYKWLYSLVNGVKDSDAERVYKEYLNTYFSDTFESDFQKSKDTVEFYKSTNPDIITIVIHPIGDKVIIFDGTHRAAIAKAMGHKFVKCLIHHRSYEGVQNE